MNSISPNLIESALVTFEITSDSKEIDATIGVEKIETWSKINKVPRARLVILDGSATAQDFTVSNSKTFLPGAKIEIAIGYSGKPQKPVFSGIVVRQRIEIHPDGSPRLIVDISDKALGMTLGRKNAIFKKCKDSDLITKLISQNGLGKSVEATKQVHPEIVQYYATDWDMMILRAEANGMVAIVDHGKITVAAPDDTSSPVLSASFGDSILDFSAELQAETQFKKSAIESSAWEPDTQKIETKKAKGPAIKGAGNVSGEKLADVFAVDPFDQQTGAQLDPASLQAWSDAEYVRSALSKIQGTVSFQGNSAAKTGATIELAGVGDRFNGAVLMSSVSHSVEDGRWITKVGFGLPEKAYAAATPNIAAPEASGLLPPINGLQTGVVKQVAKDPEGEFRVELELPLLQNPGKTVWGRFATLYASNKIGAVFYPEIGDEVIVAFMDNDPSYPVILGSTYSKKNPPPVAPDEKNDKKALVTRSELTISFDDKDKILEIKTPGKNIITLDDKSGGITITDTNKNSIKMSSSGIVIDSASSLTLKAKSDIKIDAGANLKMSGSANASLEATQISHKAKAKFSAQGSASAEIKSSGMTSVKGSLVKIN